MKIGFLHKNMLRGNPRTEKCNWLQKSSLKECIDMEIKREYYLDKLIKRQNNGLIKVITDIRRCGKSYLLNMLFYNYLIESDGEFV